LKESVKHRSEVNLYTGLIIIAMFFAPYTQLRVGPIGITELAIIFFILKVIMSRNLKFDLGNRNQFIFTKFWLVFLFFSFLGIAYNYIFLGHISGTTTTMIFDTLSYILVTLACFSIEIIFYNYDDIDLLNVLKRIYLFSSVTLLMLFILSHFTSSLFGMSIRHYHFFRPFANNIHQVSMFIAPLPFVGLKIVHTEKKIKNKLLVLLLVVSNIITANSTGSLKVTLGFIVGFIIFSYFTINNKTGDVQLRMLLIVLLTIIVLSLSSIYFEEILRYSVDFFTAEDIGGGRQILWSNSINKSLDSPIVGYGPGAHAQYLSYAFSDAHQTLLTVILQGGVFSLLVYVILLIKIIINCRKDPFLIGSVTAILLYALGGDILRRLPIWIFLLLLYYYCLRKDIKFNKK